MSQNTLDELYDYDSKDIEIIPNEDIEIGSIDAEKQSRKRRRLREKIAKEKERRENWRGPKEEDLQRGTD